MNNQAVTEKLHYFQNMPWHQQQAASQKQTYFGQLLHCCEHRLYRWFLCDLVLKALGCPKAIRLKRAWTRSRRQFFVCHRWLGLQKIWWHCLVRWTLLGLGITLGRRWWLGGEFVGEACRDWSADTAGRNFGKLESL